MASWFVYLILNVSGSQWNVVSGQCVSKKKPQLLIILAFLVVFNVLNLIIEPFLLL